ncbi:hypothetical protein [Azospirillum brasilense]|uniref:hypothetical protein n=1 Tax=Azospirillum brasilense TaxID=192 RepID=UPI001ED9F7C9|nr:hypothetical protein [Azospirillum brasilense]UKJ75371.1 hypothetical protein H1Q64_14015 [Azospirillum brasilense]
MTTRSKAPLGKKWLGRGTAVFLLAAAAGAPIQTVLAADPAQELFVEAMNLTAKARAETDAAKRLDLLTKAQADVQRIVAEHAETKLGRLLAEGKKIGAFDPKDIERLIAEAKAAAPAEARPEPKAEAKAEAKPEPKAEAKPQPKAAEASAVPPAPKDTPLPPPATAVSDEIRQFVATLPAKDSERHRSIRQGVDKLPNRLSFADLSLVLGEFAGDARLDLIALLAPRLPERGLPPAEIAALLDRIQGYGRVRAIRELVTKLSPVPVDQQVAAATTLLAGIKEGDRVPAVEQLAPAFGGELPARTAIAFLQGIEGYQRVQALQRGLAPIMAPIPGAERSAVVRDLLGNLKDGDRNNALHTILHQLGQDLTVAEVSTALGSMQERNRSQGIKALAPLMLPIPSSERPEAARSLLGGIKDHERIEAITALAPLFRPDLTVADAATILGALQAHGRAQAIDVLAPVMVDNLKPSDLPTLLGNLSDHPRLSALAALAARLDPGLKANELALYMQPFHADARANLIKAIAARRSGLSAAEFLDIGGLPQDEHHRRQAYLHLVPALQKPLPAKEFAAILRGVKYDHIHTLIPILLPNLTPDVTVEERAALLDAFQSHKPTGFVYQGQDLGSFASALPEPDLAKGKPPAAGSFGSGDCASALSWALDGVPLDLVLGGKPPIPKGVLDPLSSASFGVPATNWEPAQVTEVEQKLDICARGMTGTRRADLIAGNIKLLKPLAPHIERLRDIPKQRAALAGELARLKELPPTIEAMAELRDGGRTGPILTALPIEEGKAATAELKAFGEVHAARVAAAIKEQLAQIPETLEGLDRLQAVAHSVRSSAPALWSDTAQGLEKAFEDRRGIIAGKAVDEFRASVAAVPAERNGLEIIDGLMARPSIAALPEAIAKPFAEAASQRRTTVMEEVLGKEIAAVGADGIGLGRIEELARSADAATLPKDAATRIADAIARRKAEIGKEFHATILKNLAELPETPEGYTDAMDLAGGPIVGLDAPTIAAVRKAGKDRADAILAKLDAEIRAKLAEIPASDEGVSQIVELRDRTGNELPDPVAQRFAMAANDRIVAIRAQQKQASCDKAIGKANLKDGAPAVALAVTDGTRTLRDLTCALAADPSAPVQVAGYEAPGLFGRTHTLTLSGKTPARVSLKELEKGKGLVGVAVEAAGKSVDVQPAVWQSLMEDWRRLPRLLDPNSEEATKADMAAGIEDGRLVCATTGYTHPKNQWPLPVVASGPWSQNTSKLEALTAGGLVRVAGTEQRNAGFGNTQQVVNIDLTAEGQKSWNAAREAFCFGGVRAVVTNYTVPAARDGVQASMVTAQLYAKDVPAWVAASPVASILNLSLDTHEPTEITQVLFQTAKGWVDGDRMTAGATKAKLGK